MWPERKLVVCCLGTNLALHVRVSAKKGCFCQRQAIESSSPAGARLLGNEKFAALLVHEFEGFAAAAGDAGEGVFGQYARRRRCLPVASSAPVPQAGGCAFDDPPGRTSRVFLRIRYSFSFGS